MEQQNTWLSTESYVGLGAGNWTTRSRADQHVFQRDNHRLVSTRSDLLAFQVLTDASCLPHRRRLQKSLDALYPTRGEAGDELSLGE